MVLIGSHVTQTVFRCTFTLNLSKLDMATDYNMKVFSALYISSFLFSFKTFYHVKIFMSPTCQTCTVFTGIVVLCFVVYCKSLYFNKKNLSPYQSHLKPIQNSSHNVSNIR